MQLHFLLSLTASLARVHRLITEQFIVHLPYAWKSKHISFQSSETLCVSETECVAIFAMVPKALYEYSHMKKIQTTVTRTMNQRILSNLFFFCCML